MRYFDMRDFNDATGYENESIGETLKEAQRYIDSQPYWNSAFQNNGLVRTICDECGEPVMQRTYRITGGPEHKRVRRSAWYTV